MLVRMSTLFGKYNVQKFDGAPFNEHAMMEFSAGERGGVRLHAQIVNIMNGELKNENGTLKGMVISTMMYGGETQMALERALSEGFNNGMTYKVENYKVTLTTGSHTIVLTPQ